MLIKKCMITGEYKAKINEALIQALNKEKGTKII